MQSKESVELLERYHYIRCTEMPEEENEYLMSDLCLEIQKEIQNGQVYNNQS